MITKAKNKAVTGFDSTTGSIGGKARVAKMGKRAWSQFCRDAAIKGWEKRRAEKAKKEAALAARRERDRARRAR